MKITVLSAALLVTLELAVQAQTPPPSAVPSTSGRASTPATAPSHHLGDYIITGSLRSRIEYWNWFDAPGFEDSYTFSGSLLRLSAARQGTRLDTQFELAVPVLVGLPDKAIAPAPQGQLGLGASYRAASGRQDASIFPKQAFVRWKRGANAADSLRLGRFEFAEGSETVPKNGTLAALKRDRIAQRLLGSFGFSHVGRSFDGVHLSHTAKAANLTLLLARPTEGVFQLNGLGEVAGVTVAYGALNKPSTKSDARVFALHYRDDRRAPLSVKVDNRPAPVRAADTQDISVTTLGAHYLRAFRAGSGQGDLLLWGALQTGDWGALRHRASAVALEAGYQPSNAHLKPWLRAGYYRGSGDGNAADGKHNTFFQVLPTPRIYARFPFYNGMNNEDIFVQAILRPAPKLTLRADMHQLRLARGNDLWYSGGGAFQDNSFGYAGRPAGGRRGLATVFDTSIDYTLSPQTSLGFYFAHARGRGAVANAYPAGSSANYAYLEAMRRF